MLSRESGVAATGEFTVPDHGGYFPPLLLVEAMAQLGGIAAGQQRGEGGVLAALEQVELPASVLPRTRFLVCSRIVKSFGRLVLIKGEMRSEGRVIACATLTLAVGTK